MQSSGRNDIIGTMSNYKKLPLYGKYGRGKYSLIDKDVILPPRWYLDKAGYVRKKIGGKTVLLHHFIIGKLNIDHKNGNKRDNRRCNLRIASVTQNAQNRRKNKILSSQYKGVSYKADGKRIKRWYSCIRINGKLMYLGIFYREKDAAIAYNVAAEKHFKSFALLNSVVV